MTDPEAVQTLERSDRGTRRELAQQLRVDSVRASAAASSGHPTSSMSGADLMAVLITKHLHYDFDSPENPSNDHLLFSNGHVSIPSSGRRAPSRRRSSSPTAASGACSRAIPPSAALGRGGHGSLRQGLPTGVAEAARRLVGG